MARRTFVSKFRLLLLGVIVTFLVAAFYGFSLVQNGSLLNCQCSSTKTSQDVGVEDVRKGGSEEKPDTGEDHKLCILVPFRDRFEELLEFAPFLGKFLERQKVNHKIVIINQLDKYRFNRASLINAGFLHTRHDCDYIAMHDVDLLPMNDELSYAFPESGPFHVAAPWLHPLYHYKTFVGGILLLQSKHFEMLNGLSNKYWGWGREDDEFFVRMRKAKLQLSRPGNLTTGYKSFRHVHDRRKRPRDSHKYYDQWEKTRRLDKETGLTTVEYTVDSVSQLTIDDTAVTVMNVYLECNVDVTPWCLQAEDHPWYEKRKEAQAKASQKQPTQT
ncbi:beta-1,4-galactosyltransferase 7 [Aplysia californica]|uniref:Beta-1,4-galactosyltransferase n=1 Tax=Aplysia californica TaxID=6500 RepID=A0ABM0JCF4_APLCA|nr:beta-1,4-galactosyltransferase 7 [Aplysia californica]XP_035827252.1 beta-1,4-galactosyltransferase 7 [Aplysia californica]